MPLTAVAVPNAKPKGKPYKLFDGRGLYLLVNPTGSKLWQFKYTLAKREKLLAFGSYLDVSLAQARVLRGNAQAQLAAGIDPAAARKAQKESDIFDGATFELVAREWLAKFSPSWAPSYSSKIIRRLERDIYPWVGLHRRIHSCCKCSAIRYTLSSAAATSWNHSLCNRLPMSRFDQRSTERSCGGTIAIPKLL